MAEEAKWYVVHTYSGYENAVAAAIMKAAENRRMQDLITEVCIPMEKVVEITEKGPKEVERKVFPGYVLVKMIMTDDSWHLVHAVRGATGFVGTDGKAVPLTDDEIVAMGVEAPAAAEKDETITLDDIFAQGAAEIKVGYNVGDTVEVIDGALVGFTGVVEELEVTKNRVSVIVSMFGRETSVDLKLDQVKPQKD